MLKWIAAALLINTILAPKTAHGFAWLRSKGELITIHEVGMQNQINSNLYADNTIGDFNVSGFNYHLYAEYGWHNKLTLGVNSILECYSIGKNSFEPVRSGAAVKLNEYFARYGIFVSKKRQFIITGQILYKTPSFYDTSSNVGAALYGGTDQHDIEFMTQLLINIQKADKIEFITFNHKQMLNLEFGYRKRFNLSFDEVKINIQYLLFLTEKQAVSIGFFKTIRIFNNSYPGNLYQQISWVKNDQNTLEVGWVSFINQKQALSLSIYADVYGIPFGSGDYNLNTFGIKIGFWVNN